MGASEWPHQPSRDRNPRRIGDELLAAANAGGQLELVTVACDQPAEQEGADARDMANDICETWASERLSAMWTAVGSVHGLLRLTRHDQGPRPALPCCMRVAGTGQN